VAVGKIERMKSLAEAIALALETGARGQALFDAAVTFFDRFDTPEGRQQHAAVLMDMAEFLAIARNDFGVQSKLGSED